MADRDVRPWTRMIFFAWVVELEAIRAKALAY